MNCRQYATVHPLLGKLSPVWNSLPLAGARRCEIFDLSAGKGEGGHPLKVDVTHRVFFQVHEPRAAPCAPPYIWIR